MVHPQIHEHRIGLRIAPATTGMREQILDGDIVHPSKIKTIRGAVHPDFDEAAFRGVAMLKISGFVYYLFPSNFGNSRTKSYHLPAFRRGAKCRLMARSGALGLSNAAAFWGRADMLAVVSTRRK